MFLSLCSLSFAPLVTSASIAPEYFRNIVSVFFRFDSTIIMALRLL